MKKRLRKKKRRGEFRECGFRIVFRVPADLSAEERYRLLDPFVAEAIEENGLAYGGGGAGDEQDGYTSAWEPRTSATDQQRQAIERWLAANPLILEAKVYPLTDAWHGDPFKITG